MTGKFTEAVVAIAAQFETKRTSKLAQRIARKTLGDLSDDLHIDACIIDAELQEVRDVLAEVVREHDDPMSDYGCTTHTCQRARALMGKLEVRP